MKKEYININEVNKQLKDNNIRVMLNDESAYRGQLFQLVRKVLKQRRKTKILLLAGPSCAGKTTTANLIKEILEHKKKKVIIVSMDDFFLNRDDTPLLPNGMPDFDGLRALNFKQMHNCFKTLFETGFAKFPRFDFLTGLNMPDQYELTYTKDTIVIFEGLHVLNPELIKHLGTKDVFKVYASATQGFEMDDFVKMSARQLRLIRRMIRDIVRRGHSPAWTMKNWRNVCDAEDTYIEPFKSTADFIINTTHSYELALYKDEFFKIVINHREDVKDLNFIPLIEFSESLSSALLPETSLMWEFIDKPEKGWVKNKRTLN